jgi:hypothetical protein
MGFTRAIVVVTHGSDVRIFHEERITYIHGLVGVAIAFLGLWRWHILFYCYTHIVTPLFNLIIHNMIHTYNEYHLGDQLIHLHYLRQVCKENPHLEFTHHCNPQYAAQLQPLCEDVPITIADLSIPPGAINSWIGYKNFFYNHGARRDWVVFHQSWFDYLSDRLEVANPIACKEDFLFDYPALNAPTRYEFDILIINSPPQSGQLPSYHPNLFTNMVRFHLNDGKKVITTHPTGMCPCTLDYRWTVTDIGVLSKNIKHIIAIDTGPLWPTFNIHNQDSVLSRCIYGTTYDRIDLAPNVICRSHL